MSFNVAVYEARTHGGERGSPRWLITGGAAYSIISWAFLIEF